MRCPLVVEHLDPTRPRGTSPEAWWRQERYRVLEGVRQRLGCAGLATAHTRDDQAETVLLKLLRGAGPRGVAGVRRRSGAVVRPLLDFRREELRGFLSARGVGWREDASNADPALPRAWVRNRLAPLLADAFPGSVAHLADFAAALADDDALLGTMLAERGAWPEVGGTVPVEGVAALPRALLRRWVLELASRLPLAEPPSRRQLEAVTDNGRRGFSCGGRPRPTLGAPAAGRCPGPQPAAASSLRCARRRGAVAGRAAGRVRGKPRPAGMPEPPTVPACSPRIAEAGAAWRSVRPGERFGGGGATLISRLLARARVPAEWRRAWPVLEVGGRMVWLPAVGVAEGWEWGDADGVVAGLEEPWERHVR